MFRSHDAGSAVLNLSPAHAADHPTMTGSARADRYGPTSTVLYFDGPTGVALAGAQLPGGVDFHVVAPAALVQGF